MQDSGQTAGLAGQGQVSPAPSRDELRRLVSYAVMAPSGGNIQAWRFELMRDGRLRCSYDAERAENFLDFERCASYLALGAAVENIVIGAAALGYAVEVVPAEKGGEQVADLGFSRVDQRPQQAALVDQIPRRCTNRRLETRGNKLSESALERLRSAAASHGAELQLVSSAEDLNVVGQVVGVCDRIRLFNELMHREMMAEVRWTPEEAERTGDGVDVRTLEINRAQVFLLKRLANYRNVRFLARAGVAKPFEQIGADSVRRSSAVGLLTVPGVSPHDYFRGGRALESLWLTASVLALGFQPLAVAPYLFARLLRGSGFSAEQVDALRRERARLASVFELRDEHAELMMFRVSDVPPPSARALRRPLEAVLRFS